MLAWLLPLALPALTVSAEPHTWESEVFYQIFPRSYRDSNGDLKGDFRGIEAGLPTIKKLGATVILINPIQKARVYHNYFADSWTAPDPAFGTLADFDRLVKAAHRLKMKVVLDMEPQYVASGHPWYVAAAKNPKAPELAYIAKPFLPNPDAPSLWYDGAKVQLAALNLNHPKVVEELKRVFLLWSSRGVDGYRIDHMMDDLDWEGKSTHLYSKLWTPIEKAVRKQYPDTFFVGEQADWEAIRSPMEMFKDTPTDACYNFRLKNALVALKKNTVAQNLEEYRYFTKEGRFQLNFLENHDTNRYASEETDPARQRTAAALMILAKGSPILYYGQEIGMKGVKGHWNNDGNDIPLRLAYRWGRSLEATGTALWYRNSGPWWSRRYSDSNDGCSLEEQESKPDSLFNWYRKMIALRTSHPALLNGTQSVVDNSSTTILGFRRQKGDQSILILANLSDQPAALSGAEVPSGKDLLSQQGTKAPQSLKFGPWQVRIIKESRP